MVVDSGVDDLIYSDRFSGVFANFLRKSISRFGIDPAALPAKQPDMSSLVDTDAKVWKDIWSAGQGVATIHDIPTVADLVRRIAAEYRAACQLAMSPAVRAA
jgi:nitronate monooxygenase